MAGGGKKNTIFVVCRREPNLNMIYLLWEKCPKTKRIPISFDLLNRALTIFSISCLPVSCYDIIIIRIQFPGSFVDTLILRNRNKAKANSKSLPPSISESFLNRNVFWLRPSPVWQLHHLQRVAFPPSGPSFPLPALIFVLPKSLSSFSHPFP